MIAGPILATFLAATALHVAPNGSDSGSCTAAQPCATLARAFAVAQPGQTVEIGAGTYPDQNIPAVSKSGTAPVRFVPEPGARPILGEVRTTGAQHLEFDGLTMDDYYLAPNSADITFRNDSMKFFFIRSAHDIRMLGGSVGGYGLAIPATIGTLHTTDPTPKNILIDGVLFHDMTRAQNPAGHMECLFVQGVDGLVLRNSRFTHCDVFDVFFKQFEAPQFANVRIDDNFFGVATDAADPNGGFYSLFVAYIPGADPIANLAVDHNSFAQVFHFDDGQYANVAVTANVASFDQNQCVSGITWSYNVFSAARCGPTDRRAATGFVDAASLDLHLLPGAAALGADGSKTAPAADIDGQQRPLKLRADAGADQRLAANLSAGGTIGAVSLGGPAAAAAAVYGRARTTHQALVPGGVRLQVDAYRVPGGVLRVASTDGRIVALGTTSAYFTTRAGWGVGSPAASAGRHDACTGLYRGRHGGTLLLARASGPAPTIRSLWLLRAAAAGGRCA